MREAPQRQFQVLRSCHVLPAQQAARNRPQPGQSSHLKLPVNDCQGPCGRSFHVAGTLNPNQVWDILGMPTFPTNSSRHSAMRRWLSLRHLDRTQTRSCPPKQASITVSECLCLPSPSHTTKIHKFYKSISCLGCRRFPRRPGDSFMFIRT